MTTYRRYEGVSLERQQADEIRQSARTAAYRIRVDDSMTPAVQRIAIARTTIHAAQQLQALAATTELEPADLAVEVPPELADVPRDKWAAIAAGA